MPKFRVGPLARFVRAEASTLVSAFVNHTIFTIGCYVS